MAFFARGIVRRIEFNLYIPFRIQNDSALPWREYDIAQRTSVFMFSMRTIVRSYLWSFWTRKNHTYRPVR